MYDSASNNAIETFCSFVQHARCSRVISIRALAPLMRETNRVHPVTCTRALASSHGFTTTGNIVKSLDFRGNDVCSTAMIDGSMNTPRVVKTNNALRVSRGS